MAVQVAAEPAYVKYLEWSPTVIGIPVRAAELLENYEGITTVGQLLQTSMESIMSIPQFSQGTMNVVLQCLADIGLPVPGFQPKQSRIDHDEIAEYDETLGLSKQWSARLFIPSATTVPVVSHPVIRMPRTSVPEPETVKKPHKRARKMAKSKSQPSLFTETATDEGNVNVTLSIPKEVATSLLASFMSAEMIKLKEDVLAAVGAAVVGDTDSRTLLAELREARQELLQAINALTSDEEDDGEHIDDDSMYAVEVEEESPPVAKAPTKRVKAVIIPEEEEDEAITALDMGLDELEEIEDPDIDDSDFDDSDENFENAEFDDETGDDPSLLDPDDELEDDDTDPDLDPDLEDDEDADFDHTQGDQDTEDTDGTSDLEDTGEFESEDDPTYEEETEEDLLDGLPTDPRQLAKLLDKLSIEDLRPIAISAGVTNVLVNTIKSPEQLRKQIMTKIASKN